MSNKNIKKDLVRNVLSKDSYWQLNKRLTRDIGIEAALLLSDLVSKYYYFEGKNMLTEDDSFYNEQFEIEKDTTLSPSKQRKALSILEEGELVSVKRVGIPPKYFYKVNIELVGEILMSK